MKRLLTIASLLIFLGLQAQDNLFIIKHKYYTTHFDQGLGYPVKVEWWVTKAGLTCTDKTKRTDEFVPDPQIKKETDLAKYYTGSGYDRGHNYPAADGACDPVAMKESFYFSNMTPQTPQLNRGEWKDLEIWIRQQALEKDSIHVWCGSTGIQQTIGKINAPEYCWKVIYIKKDKKYKAYLWKNDKTKPDGFENNEVGLELVRKLTGFKFK